MAAMAKKTESEVDRNYEAFLKVLPDLLKSHAGKFAVLHDAQVVEFFDSLADAVRFGTAKFGDARFSVQEVSSQDINLGYYQYALCHAAG